jgi:8-oxo-dGTP pyrophosphatase MutT (NUDIX family)
MREKNKFLIEVHVAGFVFRNNQDVIELLVAQRSDNREIFPSYWECGGGQVCPDENFESAVRRQIKEELNINIKTIGVVGVYEIKNQSKDQEIIPGVLFAAVIIDGDSKVDGEELVSCQWININEVDDIRFIPGMAKDVLMGFEIAQKYFL